MGCACVCVCVCTRTRSGRERENERFFLIFPFILFKRVSLESFAGQILRFLTCVFHHKMVFGFSFLMTSVFACGSGMSGSVITSSNLFKCQRQEAWNFPHRAVNLQCLEQCLAFIGAEAR